MDSMTSSLRLAAAAAVAFLLIACAVFLTPLGDAERLVARLAFDFTNAHPPLREFLIFVTDLGAGRPLWYFGVGCVAVLVLLRRWTAALVWAVVLFYQGNLIGWLKEAFERPRPHFIDPFDFGGWSFPSGHAMGSFVLFGAAAVLAWHLLHGWPRWLVCGVLALHVLLVGASRVALGAHYPLDVLGGFAAGLCMVGVLSAVIKPDDPPTPPAVRPRQ